MHLVVLWTDGFDLSQLSFVAAGVFSCCLATLCPGIKTGLYTHFELSKALKISSQMKHLCEVHIHVCINWLTLYLVHYGLGQTLKTYSYRL